MEKGTKKRTKTDSLKKGAKGDQLRTSQAKERVLIALAKSMGVVTTACEAADVSRAQFYVWMNNDPEFAAQVRDIDERAIDFVESKMMSLINGVKVKESDGSIYSREPDRILIMFFLKTRAKHRGYVERQELGIQAEPITGFIFK